MAHTSDEWILLAHSQKGFTGIEVSDMLAALPEEIRRVASNERLIIDTKDENSEPLSWEDMQRQQAEKVRQQEIIEARNGGAKVAYFGRTSIPLAMDFGYRMEKWTQARSYVYHSPAQGWRWPEKTGDPLKVYVDDDDLSRKTIPSEEEVIVRVSVSAPIAEVACQQVLADPNIREKVHIHVGDRCGPEALGSEEDLERVAQAFAQALSKIHERLPHAKRLHVFAAVPAALAFRMGCLINHSIHPPIQTYQYANGTYKRALVLGQEVAPKMKIKIQFLAAEPISGQRMRISEEHREIRDALYRGKHRDRFDEMASTNFAVRTREIQSLLRNDNSQILHFSGHGKDGYLILEDEIGRNKPLSPEILREMFELWNDDGHLRFALFMSCESFALAGVLTRKPAVIPCVIVTTAVIHDRAAIDFSTGFYEAIADGVPLEKAFHAGRLQSGIGNRDWAQNFHLAVADEAMRDKPLFEQ